MGERKRLGLSATGLAVFMAVATPSAASDHDLVGVVAEMLRSAEQGDAVDQYFAGIMYRYGAKGVTLDRRYVGVEDPAQ